MELEFLSQNWHLLLAAAIILALLILEPLRQKAMGIKMISPLRVPQVVSHDGGVVVDICEIKEYQLGHIPDSINMPLKELSTNIDKLKKYKSKPVVLTCRSGNRAKRAASILRKNDFSDIHILSGGLMAWQKENLPVAK